MRVPAAALPTLLAAMLGWWLAAAAPPADGPTPSRPESSVDASVPPGDDFFAYAGVGWIINPYGDILARTSAEAPFTTVDIDLSVSAAARSEYPCYVFKGSPLSAWMRPTRSSRSSEP